MSTLCVLYTFVSEKNKAFHQHSVHKYSEIPMKFKTGLLENVNDGGNLKAKKNLNTKLINIENDFHVA